VALIPNSSASWPADSVQFWTITVSPLFVAAIWFIRTRWRKIGQGFIRIGVAMNRTGEAPARVRSKFGRRLARHHGISIGQRLEKWGRRVTGARKAVSVHLYPTRCAVHTCRRGATVIAHSVDADGQRVHVYQLCPRHANQVVRRESIQWSGSAYAARHSEYELKKSIAV
jgi:hypothetical protein